MPLRVLLLCLVLGAIGCSVTDPQTISVTRGDFKVDKPYSALLFVHVVCLDDQFHFHGEDMCKLQELAGEYAQVPSLIAGLSAICAQMFDGEGFHWVRNGPSTATMNSERLVSEEWVASRLAACGQFAAAVAKLPAPEREHYYADCDAYTHQRLGPCFLIARTTIGYLVGYAFFVPNAPAVGPFSFPSGFPANAVCIESDQQVHPLSDCAASKGTVERPQAHPG